MKSVFALVFAPLAANICFAAAPASVQTTALDAPLACTVTGHRFIADLEAAQLIDPTPAHVESNSLNTFKPAHDASLTAFGFKVVALVAYEKEDGLFQRGDGEPVANSAYGAVVFAGEGKVHDALAAAGSPAIVHSVAPFVTAIFCKRS
ncbi:hypothetical protein [Paraburkholderia saeva]|uniref:Uncharacterized protein n=1 Tax=Paraburkholderia saeva TaxID=2777537 RepID=A0A9N8RV81_9BURK|nr:hypothetical protein [Paraburkholderia saeva]CAG4896590.1 hypothetical protein LMG31841_02332 [Paraburkholderia saeva]CAG4910698.1 hypothetical protein R70241_03857 [Paraburkholderia saeva]